MNNLGKSIFLVSAVLFSSFVHAAPPANKTVLNVRTNTVKVEADAVKYRTLLKHDFKAANGADYVAFVTLQCAIVSKDLDYRDNEDGRKASVKVWLELDGQPVDSKIDDVNFCGTKVWQEYNDQGYQTEWESNVGAYAFNFPVLNVSHGNHTLRVKSKLIAGTETPFDDIKAVVKSRTLVLMPVHVQVNETEDSD